MAFGSALRKELIQIEKLSDKVFPVFAPLDTIDPYLIYRRQDAECRKTLGGTSNKTHAIYVLNLVCKDYDEKEELEELIKNKLLSFLNRYIGDPQNIYIEDVTVKLLPETFAPSVNAFDSPIQIEIDY